MLNISRNYMQIPITRKIHNRKLKYYRHIWEFHLKKLNVDKFTNFVCCDIGKDPEKVFDDDCETWTAY
jgi:hypothetical protein